MVVHWPFRENGAEEIYTDLVKAAFLIRNVFLKSFIGQHGLWAVRNDRIDAMHNKVKKNRKQSICEIRLDRFDNFIFTMQCTGESELLPIVVCFPPLCAVCSCFLIPPNSDMDYMIYNVRTFWCVRVHMGVGHTDNESAHHFWFGKKKRLLTNHSTMHHAHTMTQSDIMFTSNARYRFSGWLLGGFSW